MHVRIARMQGFLVSVGWGWGCCQLNALKGLFLSTANRVLDEDAFIQLCIIVSDGKCDI